MNQKAHFTGGIILAAAVLIAGYPPLIASLAAIGSLFNDLDCVDIPLSTLGVHRKLLHNIFIIGFLLILSMKFQPLVYLGMGMLLHNAMDMFSASPVYLLWPLFREGDSGVGGWGVPNVSMLSFPVGMAIAVVFSAVYIVGGGHLEDAIDVWERFLNLFS